jgi:hypothetical protein
MQMSTRRACLLTLALAGSLAWGQADEGTLVVKMSDHEGQDSYEIMSPAKFAELQKDLQQEAAIFQKALSEAQAEWKADAEFGKKAFPRSAIQSRKAATVKACRSAEEAQKKLTDLEERAADDLKKQQEKDKEHGKKDKDEQEKDKAKDAEKQKLGAKALSLFEDKLEALKKGGK